MSACRPVWRDYALMGLSEGCGSAAVRHKWKEVVRTAHPDRGGKGFGEIREAYGRVMAWEAEEEENRFRGTAENIREKGEKKEGEEEEEAAQLAVDRDITGHQEGPHNVFEVKEGTHTQPTWGRRRSRREVQEELQSLLDAEEQVVAFQGEVKEADKEVLLAQLRSAVRSTKAELVALGGNDGDNDRKIEGKRDKIGTTTTTAGVANKAGSALSRLRKTSSAVSAIPPRTSPPLHPPPEDSEWSWKQCRGCGNVVHKRMRHCSSCSRPLVESTAFTKCKDQWGALLSSSHAPPLNKSREERHHLPYHAEGKCRESYKSGRLAEARRSTEETLTSASQNKVAGCDDEEDRRRHISAHLSTLGLHTDTPAPLPGLAAMRAAYLDASLEHHPSAGGSASMLAEVETAYESAVRLRYGQTSTTDTDAIDKGRGKIFVLLPCYRDPEGASTIRNLFDSATEPERINVGVVWQYALDEEEAVTWRYPATAALTGAIVTHAKQVFAGEEAGSGDAAADAKLRKFLHRYTTHQMELQEEERAREVAATSLTQMEAYKDRIREMRLSYKDAGVDGAEHARFLCTTLWRGEEFVLYAHSHTRFARGWDVQLMQELKEVEDRTGSKRVVLSAAPLGYIRRPHTNEDTSSAPMKRDMEEEVEIEDASLSDCALDTQLGLGRVYKPRVLHYPAVTRLDSLSPSSLLPSLGSQALRHLPAPHPRVHFWNSKCGFGRWEAIIRDVPPDPFCPFLHSDAVQLCTSARLNTFGYDIHLLQQNLLFHRYEALEKEGGGGGGGRKVRPSPSTEDWREGETLYAGEAEAGGDPARVARRRLLLRHSRMRYLDILGCGQGDEGEERWEEGGGERGGDDRVSLGRYIGAKQSVHRFRELSGLSSLLEGRCGPAARTGGISAEHLCLERGGLLPSRKVREVRG